MSPSPDSAEPASTPQRRWWSWKKITLCSLLGLVLSVVGWGVYRYLNPPEAFIQISKETTYITEPLTPLGLPDYAAFLNERMSQGVTPETNSAVKLWEALGPLTDDVSP